MQYYLKDINYSVKHEKIFGPSFGSSTDIGIIGNPIRENVLYTEQDSYDYKEDKFLLSEYESKKLKTLEYEVFQVIFYYQK